MAVINILKSNKNLPSTLLLSLCSLFSINTLAIDFNHDIDCKDGSCSLKGTINSEAEISFIGGEIELHTKKVDQDGFYQRKKVSLNEESKEIILNDAGSRFEEPELFPTTALKEGEKAALKYLVTKLEDSAALEKNKGIKYAINSYVNEVHGHERSFAVTAFAPDGARIIDKTCLLYTSPSPRDNR